MVKLIRYKGQLYKRVDAQEDPRAIRSNIISMAKELVKDKSYINKYPEDKLKLDKFLSKCDKILDGAVAHYYKAEKEGNPYSYKVTSIMESILSALKARNPNRAYLELNRLASKYRL